jgi:phosphoglycerate kinase
MATTFRTIDDLDVAGKRVLVRADFNVPMKDGVVTSTTRIERQAPTINDLVAKGAKVIICSHFDRPKGKVVPSMSLKPVAAALSKIINKPVAFAEDCVGPVAEAAVAKLNNGDVLLLENTRFHAGEEKNDPELSKGMAKLADVYVNDAFSSAHRAHASTEGVAHLLPNAAGRSMQAELTALSKALETPVRPVMAVVGGAKISSKIGVLENLLKRVDILVIGGAMANTFMAAEGTKVGKSLKEDDQFPTALKTLAAAKAAGKKIVLPVDAALAKEFKAGAECRIASVNDIHDDEMMLDVGPASIEEFKKILATTKTVVWNGPFGAFEIPPFDKGTVGAATAVAEATQAGKLLSVAGGGDTVSALNTAKVADKFSYVSTAGGAFLEWLEGLELPGVVALAVK